MRPIPRHKLFQQYLIFKFILVIGLVFFKLDKKVDTYMEVKDVSFQRVRKAYVYEVASAYEYIII